jgi:hypothetical protein
VSPLLIASWNDTGKSGDLNRSPLMHYTQTQLKRLDRTVDTVWYELYTKAHPGVARVGRAPTAPDAPGS